MDNCIYKVIWNENEIGEISELANDMWYIDGKWSQFHTFLSIAFEEKLKSFDPKILMKNPENGLPVILQNIADPQTKLYCLAIFMDGQTLSLRQIIAEEALNMFFPKR